MLVSDSYTNVLELWRNALRGLLCPQGLIWPLLASAQSQYPGPFFLM